jgi:hypothetical protein
MAQPASASFPPSQNSILLMRELKSHIDLFSEHLQKALKNHELTLQAAFLRDLSQNVAALDKLTRSIPVNDMPADVRTTLEEISAILTHILNMPVDTAAGTAQMSIVQAIKNYSTPSTRESDLSIFLRSLDKYPESFRILIQELHLISQDLDKHL